MSERINSRTKGSKNERELCKLFTEWTGYEFSRTPSSGGLRWQRTDDTVGDIICTHKRHSRRFKFSIEAKFHKEINFEHLILGNKKVKILEFWSQALEDAERSTKIPMLLMRYNGMSKNTHFVIFDSKDFVKFFHLIPNEFGRLTYSKGDTNLVIVNSNDFFNSDYKQVYAVSKELYKLRKTSKKNGAK